MFEKSLLPLLGHLMNLMNCQTTTSTLIVKVTSSLRPSQATTESPARKQHLLFCATCMCLCMGYLHSSFRTRQGMSEVHCRIRDLNSQFARSRRDPAFLGMLKPPRSWSFQCVLSKSHHHQSSVQFLDSIRYAHISPEEAVSGMAVVIRRSTTHQVCV